MARIQTFSFWVVLGLAACGGSGGNGVTGGSGASGSGGTAGAAGGSLGGGGTGGTGGGAGASGTSGSLKTVFVIAEENHDWSEVKNLPFIHMLQQMGAHAENYNRPNVPENSEPNYIWFEAGTYIFSDASLGTDNPPAARNSTASHDHLVALLEKANIPWKAYQESISGTDCPLADSGDYAPRHNPFVFFQDVTGNNSKSDMHCIQHIRPYTDLANDLHSNNVARYNFITPNLQHDMHDGSPMAADSWLQTNVPMIMASDAYKNGGAIFIVWDEGDRGNNIGMIVVSPLAKPGYSTQTSFDHSSFLKTLQLIFGVTPLLGHALDATTKDLGEMFQSFP